MTAAAESGSDAGEVEFDDVSTPSMAEALEKFEAEKSASEGEPAKPEETEPKADVSSSEEKEETKDEPEKEEKPRGNPEKARFRVAARKAEREKLSAIEQQQAELAKQQAQIEQMGAQLNQRAQRIQAAVAAGNYDEVLKEFGAPSLAELQRTELERLGAAPKKQARDPEMEQLLQWKQEQERQQQEYIRQQQEYQRAQLEQQERERILADTIEDIGLSGYEHAELAKDIPGFAVTFLENMENSGDSVDEHEIYNNTLEVYREFFTRLQPIFGGGSPDPAGAQQEAQRGSPGQPGASAGKRQGGSRARKPNNADPEGSRTLSMAEAYEQWQRLRK